MMDTSNHYRKQVPARWPFINLVTKFNVNFISKTCLEWECLPQQTLIQVQTEYEDIKNRYRNVRSAIRNSSQKWTIRLTFVKFKWASWVRDCQCFNNADIKSLYSLA